MVKFYLGKIVTVFDEFVLNCNVWGKEVNFTIISEQILYQVFGRTGLNISFFMFTFGVNFGLTWG